MCSTPPGEHPAAAATLRQAIALFRDVGDPDGEAETRNRLGDLLLTSTTPAAAEREYTAALGIARAIGTALHEAHALEGVGMCALRDGQPDEGAIYLRRALVIYRRIGSPHAVRVETTLRRHGSSPDPAPPGGSGTVGSPGS